MKYLLDTSTASQPSKPRPDSAYVQWAELQRTAEIGFSVISVLELKFGLELMRPGKRRAALQSWVDNELLARFTGRILPVTEEIAADAGRLIASNKLQGYQIEMADALIAATARVHGLSVVTLNRKHFERLAVPLVSF